MTARASLANLLRLGCGAFLVATAAVWGPYAQLLRVSVANERGNDLLVVAADLERGAQPDTSRTHAPKHLQAVSSEGEAPTAPRVLAPVLDDADLSPAPQVSGMALPGLVYGTVVADAGPPSHAFTALVATIDAAPRPSAPARAPPSA